MPGIQGLSGSPNMMKSCGMEGMHGSSQQKQKSTIDEKKQLDVRPESIPHEILGKNIDMSV